MSSASPLPKPPASISTPAASRASPGRSDSAAPIGSGDRAAPLPRRNWRTRLPTAGSKAPPVCSANQIIRSSAVASSAVIDCQPAPAFRFKTASWPSARHVVSTSSQCCAVASALSARRRAAALLSASTEISSTVPITGRPTRAVFVVASSATCGARVPQPIDSEQSTRTVTIDAPRNRRRRSE